VQVISSGISNKKRIKNNQNNENTRWLLSEYYGIIWSEKKQRDGPFERKEKRCKR
jgi:hypothetical protein